VLEVELNIIASDVGGHGNDGSSVELADQMTGRHAVQVRHNDIHQDQIVLGTTLHLVHCFQAIELNQQISFRRKDYR
jgi:hypothetical protein